MFRNIDTARSLEVTEFAKPIIGIDDWSEVVPGWDPGSLDVRTPPGRVAVGYRAVGSEIDWASHFQIDAVDHSLCDGVTMVGITVTEASVRRAADPLSFQRGQVYANAGHVRDLRATGATVRALVEGTHTYRVTLTSRRPASGASPGRVPADSRPAGSRLPPPCGTPRRGRAAPVG